MSFDKFTVCILATERVKELIDTFNFKIEDLATGKQRMGSPREVDEFETDLNKLMWKNEAIRIHCITNDKEELKEEELFFITDTQNIAAKDIDKLLDDWNKIDTEWE